MRIAAALLVVLLELLTGARLARAHPAPHSSVLLDLRAADVGAELRLPVPELEAALHRSLLGTTEDLSFVAARVERDLHVESLDGAPWSVRADTTAMGEDEQVPVVVVKATLTPPPGVSARALALVDDVIGREVQSHVAWVAVRSDFTGGFVSGSPQVVGATHYLRHRVVVDRQGGGAARGFVAVFQLGVQHIAEGTDHLVFLLALLLPAPLLTAGASRARRCWGAPAGTRASLLGLLRIVTAFTVGHSFTLVLGALGGLRLPGAPVETLIAVSILVSSVHARRPLFPGREAQVAGAFGLVHGLAFAGALTDLHLDPGHLALALLAFNLGVEAMQLAVVAASAPWLLLLARTPWYAPFRIAGACLAGVAAVAWIGERALHLPNPVDAVVTASAAHARWLLAGLAVFALAAKSRAAAAARRVAAAT